MQRPMRRYRPRQYERRHVAYDLETTAIAEGTPTPLYLSVCDESGERGYQTIGWNALHDTVVTELLTVENRGTRFVGYNSNRFDAFIIATCLKDDPEYIIEPWLTKAGNLRGMRIRATEDKRRSWLFSDAMAMTGFLGKLEAYTKAFSPELSKQHIDIIHFDPFDETHQRYAINDAKILYHANVSAFGAMKQVSGIPPQNTIGKLGITYFQRNMPKDVLVWRVPKSAETALQHTVRGGYVYCDHRHYGQTWKYDINQAYASAMREPLPSGRCYRSIEYETGKLGMYLCTISRRESTVPFYIRDIHTNTAVYTHGECVTGWILSTEYEYLRETGWSVEIHDGWVWTDHFTMRDMVDHLEHERATCDGGPKGPMGLMIKALGNNSFGKTLETHDGMRMVFATDKPDNEYHEYRAEDEEFANIWFKMEPYIPERYHMKQIGSFITAYVRVKLMRTALLNRTAFVYADTDCIAFSEPMTDALDIDNARYGAFKIESVGTVYGFIAKKTYWIDIPHDRKPNYPVEARCKGLNPNEITLDQWRRWYHEGIPPAQRQIQRMSIVRTLETGQMFRDLTRNGSRAMPFAAD